MMKKAINQYDKQGHYLRTFDSVSEAKRMTGIITIFHTLREDNPRPLAGGYQWRYDTGNHADISPPSVPGRPVIQIDPVSGQIIREFPSLAEAARAVGRSRQNIFMNCQGETLKAGGFVWRYADSPEGKKAAKKTQSIKAAVIIQSPTGGEIKLESMLAKIGAVDKVYIRADVNKAYWIKGKETGEIELW